MSLEFVNYLGRSLPPPSDSEPVKRKKKAPQIDSFHKGFRVVGVTEVMLANARLEHEQKQKEHPKKQMGPFDENNWLMNARKKPIRSKPYELIDAANVCADLARKAGWLAVEVLEIKRDIANI